MSSCRAFSALAFLTTNRAARTARDYGRSETIFTPGDSSETVFYVRVGGVRLPAVSGSGTVAAKRI